MIKIVVALGVFCSGLFAGGFGSVLFGQKNIEIDPLEIVQSARQNQLASAGSGSCGN
ncbi:hypothetical protein KAI58_00610 [Candidatus Gracilibacteria bacterium]|nr:hypothetical protein [Candidatus Gracilibacteria bacterium]